MAPPADWLCAANEKMAKINDYLRPLPLRYNGNETMPLIEMPGRSGVSLVLPITDRRGASSSISMLPLKAAASLPPSPSRDCLKVTPKAAVCSGKRHGQPALRAGDNIRPSGTSPARERAIGAMP